MLEIIEKLMAQKSEKGQDLAEYAVFLGLIALAVIASVTVLGENISDVFSALASQVGAWW